MLLLPPATLTPEAFGELLVGSSTGHLVPMASVATIRETEGPAVINRESLQRRVLVEVNVRGRDLVSFVNEARQKVADGRAPGGRHAGVGRSVRELHPRQQAARLRRPAGAGGDLRDAVPDVRRPSLRDRRVRQRAARAGGRRAGPEPARPAVLDPGGGRLHRGRRRGGAERRRDGRRSRAAPRVVGGHCSTTRSGAAPGRSCVPS